MKPLIKKWNEMLKPARLQRDDKVARFPFLGWPRDIPSAYLAGKQQLETAFGVQLLKCRTPIGCRVLSHNPQAGRRTYAGLC
jgi:hypothetical protein